MITVVVQVNGKVRAELIVEKDISAEEVIKLAKNEPKVASYLEGKSVKKEIYVPGRLISLVI
jgi:leucyl-tRNA synthetase